jgi:hypothetical protein
LFCVAAGLGAAWWFTTRERTGGGEDFDPVDLASDDSFPASDPPSHSAATGAQATH